MASKSVPKADELTINFKLYDGSKAKDKPERLFKDKKTIDGKLNPFEMLERVIKEKDLAHKGKSTGSKLGEKLYISGTTLLTKKWILLK